MNFTQQYGKNCQRCQKNKFHYDVWQLLLCYYREFSSKVLSVWAESNRNHIEFTDFSHVSHWTGLIVSQDRFVRTSPCVSAFRPTEVRLSSSVVQCQASTYRLSACPVGWECEWASHGLSRVRVYELPKELLFSAVCASHCVHVAKGKREWEDRRGGKRRTSSMTSTSNGRVVPFKRRGKPAQGIWHRGWSPRTQLRVLLTVLVPRLHVASTIAAAMLCPCV